MVRLAPSARSSKVIVSPLSVYAWIALDGREGFVLAGELDLEEFGNAREPHDLSAAFAYDPDYLDLEQAYPLDPINMPLVGDPFRTEHAHVRLGAIFDAAPDAWGRRVIHASDALSDQAVFRSAFLRGADGIGSLLLKPAHGPGADAPLPDLIAWSRSERPSLDQLDAASNAASQLEAMQDLSEQDLHLLAGSWTIGGARPKAIVRNVGTCEMSEALRGHSLIAKLPGAQEQVDRAAIEWACLRMVKDMGFDVPGHALAQTGRGRALLLERFDRYPVPGSVSALEEGRLHYISANSLFSALPQSKRLDTAADKAIFSIGNLVDVAARVATRPREARLEMFGRAVLNAAVHNTDDHAKNFGFLQDREDRQGFRVAPVFDVSPQSIGSHYLHAGSLGRRYTAQDLVDNSRSFGVAAPAARTIRDQILTVLDRRHEYFDMAKLPSAQVQAVDSLITIGIGATQVASPAPSQDGGGPKPF